MAKPDLYAEALRAVEELEAAFEEVRQNGGWWRRLMLSIRRRYWMQEVGPTANWLYNRKRYDLAEQFYKLLRRLQAMSGSCTGHTWRRLGKCRQAGLAQSSDRDKCSYS